MTDASIPELDVPFTFSRRPMSVPGDLRPEWRVALLLMILRDGSRGDKSSFARLHVLNWALQTQHGQAQLAQVLDGVIPPDVLYVRFDPALNRAVDLAAGQGLLRVVSGSRVELTPSGEVIADELKSVNDLLSHERTSLATFRGRVTEKLVAELFRTGKGL